MSEILGQILSAPIVTTTLLGLAVALVGAWLAATWWAYQDASRRAESELPRWLAAAWVLLSGPLLLPFSIGVYTLLRPQEVVGDRRTRQLVAALQASDEGAPGCPGCGEAVDPEWARCPACKLWLARLCERCHALAPVDAQLCPWCAWEPAVLPVEVPAPEPLGAPAAPRVAATTALTLDIPELPVVEADPIAAMAALFSSPDRPRAARPWQRRRGRHEEAPGQRWSRESETLTLAEGPVEA